MYSCKTPLMIFFIFSFCCYKTVISRNTQLKIKSLFRPAFTISPEWYHHKGDSSKYRWECGEEAFENRPQAVTCTAYRKHVNARCKLMDSTVIWGLRQRQMYPSTETSAADGSGVLTVSCGFVFIFMGVGTVSSWRAGAYAEDVPGRWFQTWDDHTGSSGARRRVAQLLVFLWEGVEDDQNNLSNAEMVYTKRCPIADG